MREELKPMGQGRVDADTHTEREKEEPEGPGTEGEETPPNPGESYRIGTDSGKGGWCGESKRWTEAE